MSVALIIRQGTRYLMYQLIISWSVVYGILLLATSDRALAKAPLEQGRLGGQAALGIFPLKGCWGHLGGQYGHQRGSFVWRVELRGLAMRSHSCSFLVFLIVLPGMSRDRRIPTRMSDSYPSHWHDSTSSGPTTGRVGWQHRPLDLASSNPSPHGPLVVLRQNLAMTRNHQLLRQP